MQSIPDFDSLPPVPGQPQGNAWGLWGEDDQLGKTILAAKQEIQLGKSVSLDLALDHFPPLAGRQQPEHEVISLKQGGRYDKYGFDDALRFNTQASSQWDGLRHIALQESALYYNGVSHDDIAAGRHDRNGIHKWVERGGIVGRAVLLDYARWRQETGQPCAPPSTSFAVTVAELGAVAAYQNVQFHTGDILIIRFGFIEWHDQATPEERAATFFAGTYIGLERSMETVRWLWNHHFAALAGDTVGFECCPSQWKKVPGVQGSVNLHEWILAHWGCPLGELWNLEQLATVCNGAKKWTFFFTSAPLYVVGGVASPPNAIAIL
ncbi:hypothetical protein AYO20_03648 [Fonsecaea nubica]|uniref:Cyclase n=1 Tax=Fonsecaea nubica TaxID=856822 RepID=A0A178D4M7_9EURO|nr:hypothetical protein AYO20_03648 [Fonsecaea nubica]OAL37170.1 hypothetical protein AYO20_03648 [Fonsecaea nubica]